MIATVVLCAFVLASQNVSPAQAVIRGVVVDASGGAVSGARVDADGRTVVTDAVGRFSIAIPAASAHVVVRVHARGFIDYSAPEPAGADAIRIILQPQGVTESVTVTAARTESALGGSAAPGSVVLGSTVLTSGSGAIDDVLREVPGFSLFRRTSSWTANPTTQGASLRGLSASGSSRVLVLADGVPLNDPFGGWVYWDRVPRSAIERIETVRGGGALYGPDAIAGVIQLFTLTPARPVLRIEGEGGSFGLGRASAFAGTTARQWTIFGSAERMVFDGAPVVAEDERGPVDTNAGVDYWSALASAGYATDRWNITARGGWLTEDRANGTPMQRNDTDVWHAAGRLNIVGAKGVWTATGYGGRTSYHQSFSAVNQARSAERLTSRQAVGSDYGGGALQWAGSWPRLQLVAGGESKRVGGQSDDTLFVPYGGIDVPVGQQHGGGAEHDYALYSQLSGELSSSLGAAISTRVSRWSSEEPGFEARRFGLFMPRASIAWTARPWLSVHASWSNPARTPTLNELHRDFRVGSVYTQANPALTPENANSIEAGALTRAGRVTFRGTVFWTRVADAITNVTDSVVGGVIYRKRSNAGVIRARGGEVEAEWRAAEVLTFTATATAYDSVFVESAEPGLAGNRVPQVPRWSGTVSARSAGSFGIATVTWRAIGPQFDDDRNQFLLDSGQTVDAYLGKQVRAVQVYVAVENLFDSEVEAGKTPVTTVGLPRTFRMGGRLLLP